MMIWDWLQQHANAMTTVGNLLLVLIWAVYLQMFYQQTRRFHKSQLLIHLAQGAASNASCLLVNMSKEVVHIECVILVVESEQATRAHQVTEYQQTSEDGSETIDRLRQGPLKPGEAMRLGRLERMVPGFNPPQQDHAPPPDLPEELCNLQAFELRAVAVHGPNDRLVGARRRFLIESQDGQTRFPPEEPLTEQLRSRRVQKRLRCWLHDSLTQTDEWDWREPSDLSLSQGR